MILFTESDHSTTETRAPEKCSEGLQLAKQGDVDAPKDFKGIMIFVSQDLVFLSGLGSCVLALGTKSGTDHHPNVYPRSYVEYVQKLEQETPGIYS